LQPWLRTYRSRAICASGSSLIWIAWYRRPKIFSRQPVSRPISRAIFEVKSFMKRESCRPGREGPPRIKAVLNPDHRSSRNDHYDI
jgi:hypothetical protein